MQTPENKTARTTTWSMARAHDAVILAADTQETFDRLAHHRHPAVKKAMISIREIADMHAQNDYNRAREIQLADDALFYLPLAQIEALCRSLHSAPK